MKTTNRFFVAMTVMLLLFSTSSFSQEDQRPLYVSVTTMHFNTDNDGDDWKAVEKEYMDKVTKKNEHIRGASFHTHLMTPDSREVLYVQSYPSWEAIDAAAARNSELEKEAWPDEDARNAFLDKQGAYYSDFHSDEIYATMEGAKLLAGESDKDMVLYVRKNQRAFPEDGSAEEFNELRQKLFDNTINKNEYVKAYYPSQHIWGSDRRDFIQAFILDSLGDLDKMFDRGTELGEDALTEEEGKAMGKYFTGVHGDYVYTAVKL